MQLIRFNSNIIYFSLLIFSFITSFILKDNLENSQAVGTHTLVFFLPFFAYSFFEIYVNKNKISYYKFFFFILISFLPITFELFNGITHLYGDDSYSYFSYANYMVDNWTLTSEFHQGIKTYDTQPGIAYIYALEIILFQETRFLQLFNLIIFFLVLFIFLQNIIENNSKTNVNIITFLLFLSIPFAIKNILMCYTEWFVVLLFFLSYLSYKNKYYYLFVFLISIIPFVRQNLLLVDILLFIFFIFNEFKISKKINFKYFFIYFLFILLPLYHNLYYANSFVFFTTQTATVVKNSNSLMDYFNINFILNNFQNIFDQIYFRIKEIFLLENFGSFQEYSLIRNKLISIFVPFSVLYIFYILIFKINSIHKKFFFFLCIILTFLPSLILGAGGFPRFEFVNICFCFTFFYILSNNLEKN